MSLLSWAELIDLYRETLEWLERIGQGNSETAEWVRRKIPVLEIRLAEYKAEHPEEAA